VLELLTILVLFGLPLVLVVMLHVTGFRARSDASWKPWRARFDDMKERKVSIVDPSDPGSRVEHGLPVEFPNYGNHR